VSLQSQAVGTKGVFPSNSSIRKKLFVLTLADWTFHFIPFVELGKNLHHHRTYCLKNRSGYVADDKADDGFHGVRNRHAIYQMEWVSRLFFLKTRDDFIQSLPQLFWEAALPFLVLLG
jgi:hypothetical protein